ncbi:MAG: GIY-YIG nuclease family protein [Cyanobacteria bacterium P01_A01_bin.17]
MTETSLSVVYVLTNSAMPGLVKIGKTLQDDHNTRVSQLYTTGVPVPFDIEYACRVPNPTEVEAALHTAFAPQRINPRREFFEIDPDQAIAILRLLNVEDVTDEVKSDLDGIGSQDQNAATRLRARRPSLNFEEMGIPIGSQLDSVPTDDVAIVVDAKKISFRNSALTSLSAATREMLGLDYSVKPTPHWSFSGKNLQEIYNETYAALD